MRAFEVGNRIARHGRVMSGARQTPRHQFSGNCKQRQDESPSERHHTEIGVKDIDEDQIERHPRQVEEGNGALASQKAADRIDIPAAFQRLRCRETEPRHVDGDLVRQRRQLPVELRPYTHENLGADDVEDALE